MPRQYYVYLIASISGVLYVGVTSNLQRRVSQHKLKHIPGFTSRYNVDRLVYYQTTTGIQAALAREKQIKAWRRSRKNELIQASNPGWLDLSAEWGAGVA